jgi:tRNA 2-thiouridine synthesizing protein A
MTNDSQLLYVMASGIPVDETLDTFGLLCPMPIIKTAARMKKLVTGNILKVLSDDPGILEDMPAWCVTSGNELIQIDEVAGEFHVYIRKTR